MQSAPAALDSLASQVRRALDEDRAFDDATSQVVVPEEERGAARIVAKQEGVLAGLAYAGEAFSQCCPDGSFSWLAQEGDRVQPGQVIWKGSASAR
ncbi:MAG: nicotinate-nucleotide diphosphorylase (carboxylating), partial [Planctomycetes bacterium]|nr:nicotinate-nucleotide diphosphorylase (carboxylating) [Planctomycetota bacterium]